MSEDFLVWSGKKFDGTNFRVWKFQMTALLRANEVWDVVDGSRIMPVVITEHETEAKLWEKDNAKAMFLISTALTRRQLQYLLRCATAKEMWEKLISIHQQKTSTFELLKKFHTYRMDPNDTVMEHVSKIKNLAADLEDVGEKLSSECIVAKVLISLPLKFNLFRTCWENMSRERQTLEALEARLICEEARLNAHNEKKKEVKPGKPKRW